MRKLFITVLLLLTGLGLFGENLNIATWNIEHLGSPGRGLGYRNLPLRTPQELDRIANWIDEMDLQVLALQEVAVSHFEDELPQSSSLDHIAGALGPEWRYAIAPPYMENFDSQSIHNMQNAYLWDSSRVILEQSFALPVSNVMVGRKRAFSRRPWAAWFSAIHNGERGNDFLLVNLHLASGQDNDENHLAAMVMVEQAINPALSSRDITESDRIVLGDFNDNPWALNDRGEPRYMDLMYRYMEERGYQHLTNEHLRFTRLNDNLDSIIDHVLINRSALRHYNENSFLVAVPEGSDTPHDYNRFREVYSDHCPLIFSLKVGRDDDAD